MKYPHLAKFSVCLMGMTLPTVSTTQLAESSPVAEYNAPCVCQQPQEPVICVNDPVYTTFLKIKILRYDLPNQTAMNYAEFINKYSRIYNIDPDLITAVIRIESYWNPRAQSEVGARGLMQVMPFWIDKLQYGDDLYDPETSIRYGTRILKAYRDMYPDNFVASVAAYNQGPYLVDRDMKGGTTTWRFSTNVLAVYKILHDLRDLEERDPSVKSCYHLTPEQSRLARR